MIRVRDLSKTFGRGGETRAVALGGVSFEVRPGEIFGLLGPNGAGKTTCLRILSTVLAPTGGTAEVAGFDVTEDPADVRRSIGFLSNNTGLYDRMTPRETVEHYGRLYGLDGTALRRRVAAVLDTLRMGDFADDLCSKLSTGQKQKASIARALIHDPPVLIFDEPTAGLDVLVARNVLRTVAALRDAGKCVIFSTHIMREVEKLCDRVAIVHRGRVLDQGRAAGPRRQARRTGHGGVVLQADRAGGRKSEVRSRKSEVTGFARLKRLHGCLLPTSHFRLPISP